MGHEKKTFLSLECCFEFKQKIFVWEQVIITHEQVCFDMFLLGSGHETLSFKTLVALTDQVAWVTGKP